MSTPNEPQPSPTGADKGSMLTGFFIGWGVVIGSWVVTGAIIGLLSMVPYGASGIFGGAWLVAMLPQAAIIAVLVWAFAKGKTRTGLGILVAIGSMLALVLLLVAACFGLMANSNWH